MSALEMLELDQALTRLAELDERMARVVEMRIFAGLSVKETAYLLTVSERTVASDWRVARMWLAKALAEGGAP
jgi:DNA-directed RNA polymerase specialized sigma24 family protein